MEKSGCFVSSALVSSLLGGVEEEGKNPTQPRKICVSCLFPLICLFIALAFILLLAVQLWMLEECHSALGPSGNNFPDSSLICLVI